MLIEERNPKSKEANDNDRSRQREFPSRPTTTVKEAADWVNSRRGVKTESQEQLRRRCQLIITDLMNHNSDDPAAKRAQAERGELTRTQDVALADPEGSTIVIIADVGSERSFRRRMIKVNDKRSYVRGRAVVSAKEVQWADPTILASKNWNFLSLQRFCLQVAHEETTQP